MNSSLRTPIVIALVALLAVAGATWLLISIRSGPNDGTLRAKFGEYGGFDGDPAIQAFRDGGQAAVIFLARQLKSDNSGKRIKAAEALRAMGQRYMLYHRFLNRQADGKAERPRV